MNIASINNKYAGYIEANNSILINPTITCEHDQLTEILKDLFCDCGEYKIYYEYDGFYIRIKQCCYTPSEHNSIRVDRKQLDYLISNMSNWQNKRKIINEV